MKKLLKSQRGISVISLMIIIIIFAIVLIFARKSFQMSHIENLTLTKYNIEDTLMEYAKIKEDTDELIYVKYAVLYYTTLDYISSLYNSKPLDNTEKDALSAIYGKTIKKLKDRGKSLMEKNNITVEDMKDLLDA